MIRIEASAICSHGMCEGMPADSCSDTGSLGTVVVFEASVVCSHGLCEGVPADSCSDTGSLGTVVVFEASTEGSMKVSSVFNVKASGGSSTAVLGTGSATAWPSGPTS